jgi:uncharacterized protein (DUF1330 family)
MNRYTVIPRGKKYLVEEIDADGTRRIVISFPTEEAAVSCARELQRRSEGSENLG